MALGTNHITTTTAANFIPELWLDEIRRATEANLVAAKVCKHFAVQGKKGDTLHVPDISNLAANTKAAQSQVTLQAITETEFTMTIGTHIEASFLVEDIVAAQSQYALRSEYTQKAGYAIAKKIDTDVLAQYANLASQVIGGDGSTAWDPNANTNTGNGTDLTDAGIRRMIQTLEDANVPSNDLVMIIPPSQKNVLSGIQRFSEYISTGAPGLASGGQLGRRNPADAWGNVYEVDVYVTTQCPTVTATDGTTQYRVGLFMHKDALVLAQQMAPRVQSQYKQEYLGTLVTADTLYGVATFRADFGLAFYTPA